MKLEVTDGCMSYDAAIDGQVLHLDYDREKYTNYDQDKVIELIRTIARTQPLDELTLAWYHLDGKDYEYDPEPFSREYMTEVVEKYLSTDIDAGNLTELLYLAASNLGKVVYGGVCTVCGNQDVTYTLEI